MFGIKDKKQMSSFNGSIREISGICVDNFENPSSDGARAYFLSHYHSDHTVGLDTKNLEGKLRRRNNVFIYTTKITAAIIAYDVHKVTKDYVKPLDLGVNTIIIPGDEENKETYINVTLIPAGHCFGSTMFLFETNSVKVLYTGDFRIRPNDLPKYSAFHDESGVVRLDKMYVDTTFLHNYESFPKRSDSVEETVMLLREYLDSSKDQLVILETSAKYGYEYVFNQIHKSIGMKVYVDEDKWEFYSTVQKFVPGVTNNGRETRIFLKRIPDSIKSSRPTKTIKFSAYRWTNWSEHKTSIKETGDKVFVCFSTHCSRTELISFVEYFRPVSVEGFPNKYIIGKSPIKTDGESFTLSPKKSPQKINTLKRPRETDKKIDDATLKRITGAIHF